MRVPVKKFFAGGLVKMGAEALDGIGQSMSGVGQGIDQFSSINDKTNINRQQAIGESSSAQAFADQRKRNERGEAGYDIASSAVGGIPLVGGVLKGGMDLVNSGINALKGPKDEFGITKGEYRRNSDLARSRDTFGIDETNQEINTTQLAGANMSFNTPQFQAPQFGKFGMKFKRFR